MFTPESRRILCFIPQPFLTVSSRQTGCQKHAYSSDGKPDTAFSARHMLLRGIPCTLPVVPTIDLRTLCHEDLHLGLNASHLTAYKVVETSSQV